MRERQRVIRLSALLGNGRGQRFILLDRFVVLIELIEHLPQRQHRVAALF